jgi:DNA-binding NarL/FixJ family response regulator
LADTGRSETNWSVAGQVIIDDRRFWVMMGADNHMAARAGKSSREGEDTARFRLLGRACCIVPVSEEPAQELARLLTARELQIAILIGEGTHTKRIAYQLHISKWTVCAHLRRIFLKLGVDNRAAMAFRIERSRIEQALGRVQNATRA